MPPDAVVWGEVASPPRRRSASHGHAAGRAGHDLQDLEVLVADASSGTCTDGRRQPHASAGSAKPPSRSHGNGTMRTTASSSSGP